MSPPDFVIKDCHISPPSKLSSVGFMSICVGVSTGQENEGSLLLKRKVQKEVCACQVTSVLPDSLVTPWTVAPQAPLSMGFSRQECWSGLPCLLQGIFWTQGLVFCLLHWQVGSLLLPPLGKPPSRKRATSSF